MIAGYGGLQFLTAWQDNRHPTGTPVESKHTPEGLEPKRIGKPPQHFLGTEFTYDMPENRARCTIKVKSHMGALPLWSGSRAIPVRIRSDPRKKDSILGSTNRDSPITYLLSTYLFFLLPVPYDAANRLKQAASIGCMTCHSTTE